MLTVFAGDPASCAPAGGWDRRAGFETHGQAASARREEDRRACRALGATPVWLPYGDEQYERGGDEREIIESVHDVVRGADVALLPGLPLSHQDHAWLTRTLLASRLPAGRVAFYAEQPYAARVATGLDPSPPPGRGWSDAGGADRAWTRTSTSRRDWLAKWRALREYRTQLPLLGVTRSSLWRESRAQGEKIAWLS